jgi:hypothetical protein
MGLKPDFRIAAGALALLALLLAFTAAAQSARVVLRWKSVEGARAYELEIAEDATFKKIVVRETLPLPGYRWSTLPRQSYHWRVRSLDAEGRPGEWSAPEKIGAATAAPELRAPADQASLRYAGEPPAVELVFDGGKVMKEYVVEISTDPGFGKLLATERVPSSPLKWNLPGVGTFHWRVRGLDLENKETANSLPRSFKVVLGPPRALAAVQRLEGTTPLKPVKLEVAPLAPARAYRFEVRRDLKPEAKHEGKSPSFTFTPKVYGRYSWRAAAVDTNSQLGDWSPWFELVLERPGPHPTAPPDGAALPAVPPPALVWSVPDGLPVVGYELEVAPGGRFDGESVRTERTLHPSWTVSQLPLGSYGWRVTSIDESGQRSAPSEVRRFTLEVGQALAAPAIKLPLPQALLPSGAPVMLGWDPVPGAGSYDLELDGRPPISINEPTWMEPDLPDGEHAARARAVSPGGAPGAWGSLYRFRVGASPATRVQLELPRPLVADGRSTANIRFQLRDAEDRPVRGAAPELSVKHGRVGPVLADGDGYLAQYTAPAQLPPSGTDQVVARDRGLEVTAELPLFQRHGRFAAGGHLGWSLNGGGLSSPAVSAELSWRSPLLEDRLLATARLGLYGGGAQIELGAQNRPVVALAQLLPISALAVYELGHAGPITFHAGAGPALQLVRVWVDGESALSAGVAAHAVVGASRRAGRGHLTTELSFLYGVDPGPLADFWPGGVGLSFGYQLEL